MKIVVNTFRLLFLELRSLLRYPIEFLMNLLATTVFLGAIVFIGSQAGHPAALPAIITTMVSLVGLQAPVRYLEGKQTTNEEMFIYTTSPALQLAMFAVSSGIQMLLLISPVFLLLRLWFPLGVSASTVDILAVTVAAFVALLGFGYALAAITLVAKRVGPLVHFASFILLMGSAVIAIPDTPVLTALPLIGHLHVLSNGGSLVLLVAASVLYLFVGVMFFYYGEHIARKWGLLSVK